MKELVKKTSIMVAASVFTMASALVIGKPNSADDLAQALNLSPEQQQAFDQLHDKRKRSKSARHLAHKTMQEKTKALFLNYSPDKAQALAVEIADKSKQRALNRFKHVHSVLEILNNEQKAIFLKIMASRPRGQHRH